MIAALATAAPSARVDTADGPIVGERLPDPAIPLRVATDLIFRCPTLVTGCTRSH